MIEGLAILTGLLSLLSDGSADPVSFFKLSRQDAMELFWNEFEKLAGPKQIYFVGPFQIIGDGKGAVLAKLEISPSVNEIEGKPAIHIGFVGVMREDRGKGNGARVMQMLVDAADAIGLAMDLEISPQKERGEKKAPMNVTQLRAFYEGFGFKVVRGEGPRYMQRPAKKT
jgi:ribosomal protein S18 acetylase RimI-like enzyme